MLNPFRWLADTILRRENERLRGELAEAKSRLRVQEVELNELAAVVARNIKRVEAETAAAARAIATAER